MVRLRADWALRPFVRPHRASAPHTHIPTSPYPHANTFTHPHSPQHTHTPTHTHTHTLTHTNTHTHRSFSGGGEQIYYYFLMATPQTINSTKQYAQKIARASLTFESSGSKPQTNNIPKFEMELYIMFVRKTSNVHSFDGFVDFISVRFEACSKSLAQGQTI